MWLPIFHKPGDFSPIAWWEWVFAPIALCGLSLLAAIFFSGMLIVLPVAIVFGPFIWLAITISERRFLRRLNEQGRLVAWDDLEPRLLAGEGTLIVVQDHDYERRTWWTPDDLMSISPVSVTKTYMECFQGEPRSPFVEWCQRQYLNVESGGALLTKPPFQYPRDFIDATYFRDRFPKLAIVVTVPFPKRNEMMLFKG